MFLVLNIHFHLKIFLPDGGDTEVLAWFLHIVANSSSIAARANQAPREHHGARTVQHERNVDVDHIDSMTSMYSLGL
jgi:hypothetical protein